MWYPLVSSMPTTSQGLLIVDDTAPEGFFSLIATLFLSAVAFGLIRVRLLNVLNKVFSPSVGSFTHRLSARPRTSPNNILLNNASLIFSFTIHWIYVVVTIEQTIQRNPVIQNGPRFPLSFGQVCCAFQVDYYVY